MIQNYKAIALLLLVGLTNANAQNSIFDEVGNAAGINPIILYGIALQESSRPGHGLWPWSANIDGKSFFYQSKDEALTAIQKAIDGGSQVDVGLMQVNWKWHGHRFHSLSDALEPKMNLIIASQILSKYAHHPTDVAIGKYHCPNWQKPSCEKRARNYSRKVLARIL